MVRASCGVEQLDSPQGRPESGSFMMSDGKIETNTQFRAVSVYRRIEADLRAQVNEGRWPIGTMLPSRRNLAKQYGVDERTIQRAIASLLEDGTLRADGGRGTFVNESAATSAPRAARSTAVKTVALIFDQCSTHIYPSTQANMRGIYRTFQAQDTDCRVLTFDTHSDTLEQICALEQRALDVIETEGIDGVILCHTGSLGAAAQLSRMIENGIPIVFIDHCPPRMNCDFIGVANSEGAREAVDYLLSLGHRRIAYLATTQTISTIEERLAGYRQALQAAGIAPSPDLIRRMDHEASLLGLRQQIRIAADYFRTLPEPPTALLAVNDNVAHVFITEAEALGWSVPGDISVVGFDDIEQFSPRAPFLTTIRQPFELIGARAAELLLHNMEG